MKNESKELLTVKEASELLNINEKKLYALVGSGKIPGTKVTGKWIFPRAELNQFMRSKSLETIRGTFWESLVNKKVLLLCGSDDPALSAVQGMFHSSQPEYLLFTSSVGSREGIKLLSSGFCTIAVSHLYDQGKDDFTFPFLDQYFGDPSEVVVMNLFYRTIGFVTKKVPVKSLEECISRGFRFVNRQNGSGIRNLVERLIKQEKVDPGHLKGYSHEVYTHFDVARSVASDLADAGISAESAAAGSKLVFTPIFEERFDMVVKKDVFFDQHVQAFVEFIRSGMFNKFFQTLSGYSCRETGRVMYPKSK